MNSKKITVDGAPGTGLVATDVVSAQGHAVRMEEPTRGSYWRVRKNVKARNDDRCTTRALEAGTVLLLRDIELADGQPHVFVFAPHPTWSESRHDSPEFHAEDLYKYFEPAPDGDKVRAAELNALLLEMEQTKTSMLAPPPDMPVAGRLEFDPSAPTGEPGQALATVGSIDAMTRYAEQARQEAESRTHWITQHSKLLGEQGCQMARFHGERATAALARASASLEGVKGLLKTVENLQLYTGKGVEVLTLREGTPAPADEPLTIYQERLSLDEEALILLDSGGLDHTQVEALVEALEDPALMKRMIPSPRGAVLCRFRTNYKEFFVGDDAATSMANQAMNDASRRPMLLVRDGENLALVEIEGVLEGLEQLLPSQGEQDAYFLKGSFAEPGKRITKDQLEYARAQRRQLGHLDQYGKVLIVLWGLRDRGELFAESAIPVFANWLDPAFQNKHLALVSLDTMIGLERPNFRAWQATRNAYLASGAWVSVSLKDAVDSEFAPAAFDQGHYSHHRGERTYSRLYREVIPKEQRTWIDRVKSDPKGLYVQVPMRYDGYKDSDRTINVRVYLKMFRQDYEDRINVGFLVLDRVVSSDLEYYLTSRKQRQAYPEFITLFREAREWVRARDEAELPLRDRLRTAVIQARLPHDPDMLEHQMTDALAVARTSRRSAEIPSPDSPTFTAFWKAALACLHATLTGHGDRVERIERWARENARQPLRLALSGKEQWCLYLVPTEAEAHEGELGEVAHVVKAHVDFSAEPLSVIPVDRTLLRSRRGEQVIHDWEWEVADENPPMFTSQQVTMIPQGAAAWLKKSAVHSLDFDQALEALRMPLTHATDLEAIDLEAWVQTCLRHMIKASRGYVASKELVVPVGTAITKGVPSILLARIDGLGWAYQRGDDAIKAAARKAVNRMYNNPEATLDGLPNQAWRLCRVALDNAWSHRADLGRLPYGAQVTEDHCLVPGRTIKPRKQNDWGAVSRDVHVTGVTHLGVQLFPWLAKVTQRPLE